MNEQQANIFDDSECESCHSAFNEGDSKLDVTQKIYLKQNHTLQKKLDEYLKQSKKLKVQDITELKTKLQYIENFKRIERRVRREHESRINLEHLNNQEVTNLPNHD